MELLAILVIFTQVTSLGGFSAGEVVLIYGLAAARSAGLPRLRALLLPARRGGHGRGRRAHLAHRGASLPGDGLVIVETEGLTRTFVVGRRKRVTAVEGVTLAVAAGEAVGFLGPNGAGKSTTIKMLTGVLVPTAGRARVCGLDPVRERRELARRIGVVFGQRSQLWWDLPLRESFALHGAIHRAPYQERLDECVELLD